MHLVIGGAVGAFLGALFFGKIGAAIGGGAGVFAAEKIGGTK
jgi:hypothetical protein